MRVVRLARGVADPGISEEEEILHAWESNKIGGQRQSTAPKAVHTMEIHVVPSSESRAEVVAVEPWVPELW